MKRLTRQALILLAAALIIGAAVLSQHYLRTNLVVTAEGHEHAHSHSHSSEEDGHHHEEDHEAGEEEGAEEGSGGEEVPPETNLVVNYSFEVGSQLDIYGWTPEGTDPGTSTWRDLEVSAAGFASAGLAADGSATGSELVWKQSINTFPRGVDLEVGAMVRTSGLRGGAFVRLSAFRSTPEGQGVILAHLLLGGIAGENDWSELRGTVYIPEEVELLQLEVGIFGTGRAWVDSVRAVPRPHRLPPPPTLTNLLDNPDLSRGLEGWNLMFSPADRKAGWSMEELGPAGGRALRLQPPPTDDRSGRIFLYQAVNGLEGIRGTAVLSGRASARELEGRAFLVLVFYTPEDMFASEPAAIPGGSDWGDLQVAMEIPEGACTAFAYLVAEGNGSALFSDLDLQLQPAP